MTVTSVDPKEAWGFDFEGPAYSMDDASAWWNSDWQQLHWAGAYILPRDDDVDPSNREVQGEYEHTWNDISIESISVTSSGLGVTVSNDESGGRSQRDTRRRLRRYRSQPRGEPDVGAQRPDGTTPSYSTVVTSDECRRPRQFNQS